MPNPEGELTYISFCKFIRNEEASYLKKRTLRIICHPDEVPFFEQLLGIKKEKSANTTSCSKG